MATFDSLPLAPASKAKRLADLWLAGSRSDCRTALLAASAVAVAACIAAIFLTKDAT